jgi:hypothetical protein
LHEVVGRGRVPHVPERERVERLIVRAEHGLKRRSIAGTNARDPGTLGLRWREGNTGDGWPTGARSDPAIVIVARALFV